MRVQPFAPNRTRGQIDHRDLLSVELRGTTGRGTGFGRLRFSAASFGDTRRIAGTYQRRKLSVDRTRYDHNITLEYPVVAMRTYRPTYSNTVIQEEQRAAFAAAIEYWRTLTDEEKELYNARGAKLQMSGYNVAISDFMRYFAEAP